MGNFRARPDPPAAASSTRPRSRRARSSSPTLRAVPRSSKVDPLRDRARGARSPTRSSQGLKDLGALGMKVPEKYGGLGLSQVYYNRALALVGSWHSSLSTLLSAHQSIGVAEPLMLFGSEEQKREWLPKVAKDHVSAFLLTEPDVGSDPARLGADRHADRGRLGLPAQRPQAVGDQRRDRRHRGRDGQGAQDREQQGRHQRLRPRLRHRRASRSSTATSSWACAGSRTRSTLLEDVFVPRENLIGKEGQGLKIALTTLNTGRLALPAICVGVVEVGDEGRARVGRRARPVGPAGRQARGRRRRRSPSSPAPPSASRRCSTSSSRLADDKSADIRIEAALAQALRLRAGLEGHRRADADPRRPRLRDRRVAQGPRREAVPVEQVMRDMRINRIFEGSTEIMHLLIAREAVDQHLAVAGDILEPDVELKDKAKAARQAAAFYAEVAAGAGRGQGPVARARTREFGDLAKHLRFVERSSRKLARSTFYGMTRWQAKLEKKQGVPRPHRRHRRRAVRDRLGGRLREHDRAGAARARRAGRGAGRPVLPAVAPPRRRAVHRAVGQRRRPTTTSRRSSVLDGRYAWLEEGIVDPSGDGPDDRRPARRGRGARRAGRPATGRRPTAPASRRPKRHPPKAQAVGPSCRWQGG